MKKYILTFIIFICALLLEGCTIANTPTAKTEELLSNYQRLDKKININYYDLSIDRNLSEQVQKEYIKLIKDQYQNLSYEIKEEIIDGNTATITTSIKVKDFKKIINNYNKNEYTTEEYHNLIIDDLKDAKDKVTYTIDFTLIKDSEGNWNIDDLTNEMKEKLLGIN